VATKKDVETVVEAVEAAAETVEKEVKKAAKKAAPKAAEAAEKAEATVKKAAKSTAKKAADTAEKAQETVKKAVKATAKKAAETTEKAEKTVKKTAKKAADTAAEAAAETVAKTAKKVEKSADKAAETVKKTAKKVEKKAEAAKPSTKKAKAAPAKPASQPRLKKRYKEEIAPALREKFGYTNPMQTPYLEKVIINMGLGAEKENPKGIESAVKELSIIAGQHAVVTRAKKSVANFKVREGMSIGAKVTLRGERMYSFVDKLMNIVLPRVRDFRGVSDKAFDGRGNYAIGLKEQLIFPEINYDDVDKVRGMNIVFVTSAKTDEECKELLTQLGMPFVQG
jgi:large subunit ribosomal protein L5